MHDRDDENELMDLEENPSNSKDLDPMKQLERRLTFLHKTVKKLSENQNLLELTCNDFAEKQETFQELFKKYEALPAEMNKKMVQVLIQENQRGAETIADGVGQVLHKAIASHVDENIRKLDNAFANTSNRLNGYESRWKDLLKWIAGIGFGVILLGGLISGGVVTHYFPALTKQQLAQMRRGEMIENVWEHLSQQEQDKITRLAHQPAK